MKTKTMKQIKKKSKTNWNKVRSLTERQIIESAKSDPDAQPLTLGQLKQFKRAVLINASP